jgi:hypothetical protein
LGNANPSILDEKQNIGRRVFHGVSWGNPSLILVPRRIYSTLYELIHIKMKNSPCGWSTPGQSSGHGVEYVGLGKAQARTEVGIQGIHGYPSLETPIDPVGNLQDLVGIFSDTLLKE